MPMDSSTLLVAGATIVGGAISGGVTNIVAIWMLFRPHEPKGIGPLKLQGAIPKNKARLAKSVGKTVGEKLLTAGDIAERLAAPPIRTAFDDAMRRAMASILEREHGSVRSQLGPEAMAAIGRAVDGLAPKLALRAAEYSESDDFRLMVSTWSERMRTELAGRPVGAILTPARRALIAEQVDEWAAAITDGAGLERTLRAWAGDQLVKLEQDDRPLAERLPDGLLAPVEQAIADAMPTALSRLGAMLSDSTVKHSIQRALREGLDAAGQKLMLHQRLFAKLLVTDNALAKLIDSFEGEGFDRFAKAVTAPEMRNRVERAVQDGLRQMLREPLGSRIKRLSAERRAALQGSIGDWLVSAARSDATRTALRDGLAQLLDAAGDLTWDRLLGAVPPEHATQLLREAVQGEQGQQWLASAVKGGASKLLDQPIGRPASWLSDEDQDRVTHAISDQAWGWVQAQIPEVVGKLQVPEMVEQKILGFPTPVMEDIIKRVINRELHLIVQIGWLLGAFVGLMTFSLSRLISP